MHFINLIVYLLIIFIILICLYLLFFKDSTKVIRLLNTKGDDVPTPSHEWIFTNKSGQPFVADTGVDDFNIYDFVYDEHYMILKGTARLDNTEGLVLDGQPGCYAKTGFIEPTIDYVPEVGSDDRERDGEGGIIYGVCAFPKVQDWQTNPGSSFEILFKFGRDQTSTTQYHGGIFSMGRGPRIVNINDITPYTGFINFQPQFYMGGSRSGTDPSGLRFDYVEGGTSLPSKNDPSLMRSIEAYEGLNYDEWTHIIITIGPNGVSMYKNGDLLKNDPHVPGTGMDQSQGWLNGADWWDCTYNIGDIPVHFARWLQLGRGFPSGYGAGQENYYKGAIKHFRIWKGTELTQPMISELYNRTK